MINDKPCKMAICHHFNAITISQRFPFPPDLTFAPHQTTAYMRKVILTALVLSMGALITGAQDGQTAQGTASYYHNKFNGRKTATGAVFSSDAYTAASNKLKMGTFLKVTNLKNGKVVFVEVNDRMAPGNKRVLDVAEVVAHELGFKSAGTAEVKIEVVTADEGRKKILAQRDDAGGGGNTRSTL